MLSLMNCWWLWLKVSLKRWWLKILRWKSKMRLYHVVWKIIKIQLEEVVDGDVVVVVLDPQYGPTAQVIAQLSIAQDTYFSHQPYIMRNQFYDYKMLRFSMLHYPRDINFRLSTSWLYVHAEWGGGRWQHGSGRSTIRPEGACHCTIVRCPGYVCRAPSIDLVAEKFRKQ